MITHLKPQQNNNNKKSRNYETMSDGLAELLGKIKIILKNLQT